MSEKQAEYKINEIVYPFEKEVLDFAKKWHGDQKRKYTGEPYWHHVKEVTEIVKTSEYHNEDMVYMAYLHDVLEDTEATIDDIYKLFRDYPNTKHYSVAETVVQGVCGLTDKSKPNDGNRAHRKEIDRRHLSAQTWRVKTVKCADIISNTKDILANDKKFSLTYIPEKIALLQVLNDSGFDLYMRACYEVYKAKLELGI